MKNLIFISLFFLQPAIVFSQTQADYERVVGKFMKFYNTREPDSLISQYSDEWGEHKKNMWSTEKIDELTEKYGKMESYKYLELYKSGTGDGG